MMLESVSGEQSLVVSDSSGGNATRNSKTWQIVKWI